MLELTGDNLLLPFYSWMRRNGNNKKLEFAHITVKIFQIFQYLKQNGVSKGDISLKNI